MTKEQYQTSHSLSSIILELIYDKSLPSSFNEGLRQLVPDLTSDILSTSVNFDCPCKSKISAHIYIYPKLWAEYLYNYGIQNNLKEKFDKLIEEGVTKLGPSLSGKIASTTISEWEDFVKQVYEEKHQFYNFSVVKDGDNLLVFFM